MNDALQLYRELAARIGMQDSHYIPQILSRIASVDEAKILLKMPVRSPDEIASQLGMSKETVEEHIRELYQKGLVFYRQKGGLRHFYSVTELKDTTPSNPRYDFVFGEGFFDLWDAWFDSDEAKQVIAKLAVQESQTHPIMRLIPKWRSIKDVPGVLPCDDVRELLRAHEDSLAVNNCSCRRISRKRTSPNLPDELCIVTGAVTEYCVSRGSGRKISYLEALQLIDGLDSYGLVHLTYNAKPLVRLLGNCGPYCVVFRWSPPHTILECAKSRFLAVVDPAKCLGYKCPSTRQCARNCLFQAPVLVAGDDSTNVHAYIEADKCWGCGNCVIMCPNGAIKMTVVRPPEYIPDKYLGNF